jgi:hypothetical protein
MSGQQLQATWRIKAGLALFVASIGWPALVPILPLLGVSASATAAFSGVMFVAAEFMLVAGAAIAGKEGFALIKAKVFGFLRAYGPPHDVSRRRYIIGLVLFTTSLVVGCAWPYLLHCFPSFAAVQLACAIGFDVVLLISLFVLGGGFWDKLRALFQPNAYAVIPN